jgi:hypothetical protein
MKSLDPKLHTMLKVQNISSPSLHMSANHVRIECIAYVCIDTT